MALTIQIAEYVRRVTSIIESGFIYLGDKLEAFFYKILKPFLIWFVLFFLFLLTPILMGNNYESMLNVAEFGIIGSGTLAILTFTYAIAKKDENKIVQSGELLLKSTVALILGLGLLPLVSFTLKNHIAISSSMGVFASQYDVLLFAITIVTMIIGMVSLGASAVFFILGLRELIEVFEGRTIPKS